MLNLFRQNIFAQYAILLVVTLLMWASSFMNPVGMVSIDFNSPLSMVLYLWLKKEPLTATILAYLLMLGGGYMLNTILYNRRLIGQNTILPMFAYCILMSCSTETLGLSPIVIVNIFVIILMQQMMVPDTLHVSFDQIFNSAMVISIASLFYLPALTMLISLLLIVIIHSLYHWRHWVMLLLGLAAPYIIVFVVYFMSDSLTANSLVIRNELEDIKLFIAPSSFVQYLQQGGLILMILVGLIASISQSRDITVNRRNMAILATPLVGGLGLLPYNTIFPIDFQFLAPSTAVLIGIFFYNASPYTARNKKNWAVELLFVMFALIGFLPC